MVGRPGEELSENRRFKLLNFVHTYTKLDPSTAEEYDGLLRVAENEEVREMMMTWADEIRAQGIEQGVEEGRQQGVERMRVSGSPGL